MAPSIKCGCNAGQASETSSNRDVAQERTGKYLQRVSDACPVLHPSLILRATLLRSFAALRMTKRYRLLKITPLYVTSIREEVGFENIIPQ